MQGCAAALRVCITSVSTPVEREYCVLIHVRPPSSTWANQQDLGTGSQHYKSSCARTERAARSREPRFANSTLLFGLPWLLPEDLQPPQEQEGEEQQRTLCRLEVQLLARPSMDDVPGTLQDGRELDQLVASASADISRELAGELLRGGAVAMGLDLQDAPPAPGFDDGLVLGLGQSSAALMREAGRAAAATAGLAQQVQVQVQLLNSTAAVRPPPKVRSRQPVRRLQHVSLDRLLLQQQQHLKDNDRLLQVLVQFAEHMPHPSPTTTFWGRKAQPSQVLVQAALLHPALPGQPLQTASTSGTARLPGDLASWGQLLELRLPGQAVHLQLRDASLVLHLCSRGEKMGKDGLPLVQPNYQAQLPLSDLLPGKHYNLQLEMEALDSKAAVTKAGTQPPPLLHVTLFTSDSTALAQQAQQLPPALWSALDVRLAGLSHQLSVPMAAARQHAKDAATHQQVEVWAAWRLCPAGAQPVPALGSQDLAQLGALRLGRSQPEAQQALQQLRDEGLAAGHPKFSRPGAVLDLLPVQVWPAEHDTHSDAEQTPALWPSDHVASLLLAQQPPGTQLVLEMHQLLRRGGTIAKHQHLATAAASIQELLSPEDSGQWHLLEGVRLQLDPHVQQQVVAAAAAAADAGALVHPGPQVFADLECRASQLWEEVVEELVPEPQPDPLQQSLRDMQRSMRLLLEDVASKQDVLEAQQVLVDDAQARCQLATFRLEEQLGRARDLEGEVAHLGRLLEQERAAAHQLPPLPEQLQAAAPELLAEAYRQLHSALLREQRRCAEVVRHLAHAHQQQQELVQLQRRHQELQEAHLVQGQKLAELMAAAAKAPALKKSVQRQEEVIAELERALTAASQKQREWPGLQAELQLLRDENAFLQRLKHKEELDLLQQQAAALQQQLAQREEQRQQREQQLLELMAQRDKQRGAREAALLEQLAQRDQERQGREAALQQQGLRRAEESLLREQELRGQQAAVESLLREQLGRLEREKVAALMQSDRASAAAAAAHNELLEVTKRYAHELAQLKARLADKDAQLAASGGGAAAAFGGALDAGAARLFVPLAPGAAAAGRLQPLAAQGSSSAALHSATWAAGEARRGGSAGARMEGTKAAPLSPLPGSSARATMSADGPRADPHVLGVLAPPGRLQAAAGSNSSDTVMPAYSNVMTDEQAVRRRSLTQMPDGMLPGQHLRVPDNRTWSPGSMI